MVFRFNYLFPGKMDRMSCGSFNNLKMYALLAGITLMSSCISSNKLVMNDQEIQLTSGPRGHTINPIQVFSPDNQWIVFDARNDDTALASSGSISMVNVQTKEIRELYHTSNQTP